MQSTRPACPFDGYTFRQHQHLTMTEYYIPEYVHFAVEGDAVVFINLRLDQYSMLIGPKARIFESLILRARTSILRTVFIDERPETCASNAQNQELLADLLRNGILTTVKPSSAGAVSAPIPLPQKELLESHQSSQPPRIRLADIWSFFLACAAAKWRLTRSSIESTVCVLQRRKGLGVSDTNLDLCQARRLVRIYNRLRPLTPHNYMCLFDSLSLLEFLARHDCYPDLVFAVQLEPWAAHCWVQYDQFAFNEDIDTARTYLPLLSI